MAGGLDVCAEQGMAAMMVWVLGAAVLVAGLGVLAAWAVAHPGRDGASSPWTSPATVRETLDRLYAEGRIDRDEYERCRRELNVD